MTLSISVLNVRLGLLSSDVDVRWNRELAAADTHTGSDTIRAEVE